MSFFHVHAVIKNEILPWNNDAIIFLLFME